MQHVLKFRCLDYDTMQRYIAGDHVMLVDCICKW